MPPAAPGDSEVAHGPAAAPTSTDEELGWIEAELAKIEIHGNRTDEDIAKLRELH